MGSPTHSTSRKVLLAASFLCTCVLLAGPAANAQRRVIVMPAPIQAAAMRPAPLRGVQPPHIAMPAPGNHPVNHVSHPREQARPAAQVSSSRRSNQNFVCANGTGIPLQQIIGTTPGYGFNYQYLNSINNDIALKAAIDPATQVQLREAARLNCGTIGTGGYIIPSFGGYAAPEETDQQSEGESSTQPQVILVQVPTAAAASAQAADGPVAPAAEEAPLPDEQLFVLVLRDGSKLEATAFTRTTDTIVYITADGMRRTIQRADLDTEATIRVNGERGTQLQLSL
jgi:hypothetical protein